MPDSSTHATIRARLAMELRTLLGPTAPGADGLMQMHQVDPSRVAALYHLPSGRHAVIAWNGEDVHRSLHSKGDDGYLDALDTFCTLTGIPALDSRLARKRQAAAEAEALGGAQ